LDKCRTALLCPVQVLEITIDEVSIESLRENKSAIHLPEHIGVDFLLLAVMISQHGKEDYIHPPLGQRWVLTPKKKSEKIKQV
jgi:hypothetical protein